MAANTATQQSGVPKRSMPAYRGTAPRLARIVGHFRSALQIRAGVNAVCADLSLRRGGADVGQPTTVSCRACADGLRNDLSRGYGNCAH